MEIAAKHSGKDGEKDFRVCERCIEIILWLRFLFLIFDLFEGNLIVFPWLQRTPCKGCNVKKNIR